MAAGSSLSCETLGVIMKCQHLSVDACFLIELIADSLVWARFFMFTLYLSEIVAGMARWWTLLHSQGRVHTFVTGAIHSFLKVFGVWISIEL